MLVVSLSAFKVSEARVSSKCAGLRVQGRTPLHPRENAAYKSMFASPRHAVLVFIVAYNSAGSAGVYPHGS